MKATELRIGNNLYNFKNNIETVSGNDLKIWDKEGIPKQVKPIPLTEEWLVKFGFKKNGAEYSNDDFYIEDRNNDEYLDSKTKEKLLDSFGIWSDTEGSYFRDVKYVHQLQNLYFALTNEELILNKT